ncbi:MAG: carboxymuconolactone decarboxylase family protein [Acidobacteria bacterium]|nr:carboxymuconolactone decarboxylase family protein [Acidobacteriota bacterium]
MKSRPILSGILLASGLLAFALLASCASPAPPPEPEPAPEPPPAAAAASGGVMRVAEFEHLTTPRVDLSNEADGESPLRRACPESQENCQVYWAYTGNWMRNTILPVRHRELLILRTAWLSRGDYIWGRHDEIGKEAGLSAEEIARVTEGPDAAGWSDFEATLLRVADELHTSRFVSDATWTALGAEYNADQQREAVQIVGSYTQLAMFQNTLGVPLPDGYMGLPD